jgi:hypothetical protein
MMIIMTIIIILVLRCVDRRKTSFFIIIVAGKRPTLRKSGGKTFFLHRLCVETVPAFLFQVFSPGSKVVVFNPEQK